MARPDRASRAMIVFFISFVFSICLSFSGELPGDTQFYARRNAERPVQDLPGCSISHSECDVQTFLFKILKRIIISSFLIYGYNLLAQPLNLIIPINIITISSVSLLGIPALFSLILVLNLNQKVAGEISNGDLYGVRTRECRLERAMC